MTDFERDCASTNVQLFQARPVGRADTLSLNRVSLCTPCTTVGAPRVSRGTDHRARAVRASGSWRWARASPEPGCQPGWARRHTPGPRTRPSAGGVRTRDGSRAGARRARGLRHFFNFGACMYYYPRIKRYHMPARTDRRTESRSRDREAQSRSAEGKRGGVNSAAAAGRRRR